MLQDKRILQVLTNNDASCNPEPEMLGFVAEDGWLVAVFASPCMTAVAVGWKTWAVKPGAGGLDILGIGTENSRLLIFLCGGQ